MIVYYGVNSIYRSPVLRCISLIILSLFSGAHTGRDIYQNIVVRTCARPRNDLDGVFARRVRIQCSTQSLPNILLVPRERWNINLNQRYIYSVHIYNILEQRVRGIKVNNSNYFHSETNIYFAKTCISDKDFKTAFSPRTFRA